MTNLLDYSPIASEIQAIEEGKVDLDEILLRTDVTPESKEYNKVYVVTKKDVPDIQLNWDDRYLFEELL